MEKISDVLSELKLCKGNLYIFDYTEHTKDFPDDEKRKVELLEEHPGEINGLSILNPKLIEFYSANLEHPSNKCLFVNPENGKRDSSCEAICFSALSSDNERNIKPWMLFSELKYCNQTKEVRRLNKAYKQLRKTLDILSTRGGVDDSKYRKYFVMSLPYNSQIPFDSFIFDTKDLEEIKTRYGITVFGSNSIEIISESRIR